MSFFVFIFNTFLYQPLLNGLIFLYNYLNDFGLAIIFLTIIIKIILHPLGIKGIKAQKELSELQPKIKEIQKKYKDNQEEQMKQLLNLYKENKVNPFSGCLPLLIQFPILIALYRVFWYGLQPEQLNLLYSFISKPSKINTYFLGLVNLAQPNIFLAVLAGILQFVQVKMTTPQNNNQQKNSFNAYLQKQSLYIMPIFTIIILFRLPSAIGLYWIVITIFTIIQQYFIFKPIKLKNN